ncbi:restriction endonuclease [Nannocystaceae bacterium ST9]
MIAVRDGVTNPATLQECLGVDARHFGYTRAAAELLGMIEVDEQRRLSSTGLGDRLLATSAGSDEERAVFRFAVTHARALRPFHSFLSGNDELALERLAERLSTLTGMAPSTARRRALTLERWRRQISVQTRAQEVALSLPSLADQLERMVAHHNALAKQRVLDWLLTLEPGYFERLVAELLRAMGHAEVRVVGGSGDGGVDVEALAVDRWGHGCRIVVQAKRWSRSLGRRTVDELLGVLVRRRLDHAILIVTSGFSKAARQAAADDPRLRLVDGAQLVELMAAHAVVVGFGAHGELELVALDRRARRAR